MSGSGTVQISDVSVKFGDHTAVNPTDLTVEDGEFFTLLGPSGCGKTTLLRTIAGFNSQSSGSIAIGGQVVDTIPPHKRDAAMVFQNYAIFPHLTIEKNVEYGLKPRGIKGETARLRVQQALEMVDLSGYENRMPQSLSGGQQQRVVIARAVVTRPRVLLMDEPLANLDAKLRLRLRSDIRELQQELGITTIYVTHDQEEALSISDRIGVMSKGDLLQVGSPREIYRTPNSMAVAKFVGEGNFYKVRIAGNSLTFETGVSTSIEGIKAGSETCWIGFRPHNVRIVPNGSSRATFHGKVESVTYLGPIIRAFVDCGLDSPVLIDLPDDDVAGIKRGSAIGLMVDPADISFFEHDDEVETI